MDTSSVGLEMFKTEQHEERQHETTHTDEKTYIHDHLYSHWFWDNVLKYTQEKIHIGSYMSARFIEFIKRVGERDKMRGLLSILSLFRNEFNKFNKKRARMLDSIYHMVLRLL